MNQNEEGQQSCFVDGGMEQPDCLGKGSAWYSLANFLISGTRRPTNTSPSPYSPGPVLKNLCRTCALSLLPSACKRRQMSAVFISVSSHEVARMLTAAAEGHWRQGLVGGFSKKGMSGRNQPREGNGRSPPLVRALFSLRGCPRYGGSGRWVSSRIGRWVGQVGRTPRPWELSRSPDWLSKRLK